MAPPSYKMHSTTDSPGIYPPSRLDEVLPVVRVPEDDDTEADGTGEDPYYGSRERWETLPDGSEELRWIPLTYEDTLNPQLGDRVSHNTIHTKLTGIVSGILEMRYEDDPGVAVWSDLKVRNPSSDGRNGAHQPRQEDAPEGAKGPVPDVCVVGGVRDRDRLRESFEFESDPGEIWLAVEVVSKTSKKKDYGDILKPYTELKVQEYVAVNPKGKYVDGPVELRAWRRDPGTQSLDRVPLDSEDRFHSRTTGLFFGTGPKSRGLEIRDAATGELLRPPLKEARWQAKRAEQAEERAEQGLRRKVEDLCGLLEIEWTAERSAAVADMDPAQLEGLWADLLSRKRWP